LSQGKASREEGGSLETSRGSEEFFQARKLIDGWGKTSGGGFVKWDGVLAQGFCSKREKKRRGGISKHWGENSSGEHTRRITSRGGCGKKKTSSLCCTTGVAEGREDEEWKRKNVGEKTLRGPLFSKKKKANLENKQGGKACEREKTGMTLRGGGGVERATAPSEGGK